MHIGGNRQEAEVVLINYEVECTNIPTAIFRMHEHGQGNVTAVEWNMNTENIREELLKSNNWKLFASRGKRHYNCTASFLPIRNSNFHISASSIR